MDGLITAVVMRLQQAGVTATEAFPGGTMPKITAPVAAVSLQSVKAVDGGFGRNLGEKQGRLVETVVLVRLFTPGGRGAAEVSRVLMQWGAVGTVELQEPVYDDVADCFVTVLRAHVKGLLADSDAPEDTTAFTDFKLEGELK